MSEQNRQPQLLEYASCEHRGLKKRTVVLVLGLSAIVFATILAVILAATALGYFALGNLFGQTTIEKNTAAFVTSLRSEAKYVVASQTLSVTVERREQYKKFWVYWGTTAVKVRVDDCGVQYIIPTDRITVRDFAFSRGENKLTVTLPRPILDESLVEIPSDPNKWSVYTSSAWARFNKGDVEWLVRQSFRDDVLDAARERGLDEATEQAAIVRLTRVLKDALQKPDLAVEIRFH